MSTLSALIEYRFISRAEFRILFLILNTKYTCVIFKLLYKKVKYLFLFPFLAYCTIFNMVFMPKSDAWFAGKNVLKYYT